LESSLYISCSVSVIGLADSPIYLFLLVFPSQSRYVDLKRSSISCYTIEVRI
jgi:hypothetical protein